MNLALVRILLNALCLQERLKGNADGAKLIRKALRNNDVLEMVGQHIVGGFAKEHGYEAEELGDGRLLEMFMKLMDYVLANGPAILELILQLLSAFSEDRFIAMRPNAALKPDVVATLLALIGFVVLLLGTAKTSQAAYVVEGDCINGNCAQIQYYTPTSEPAFVLEAPADRPVRRIIAAPTIIAANVAQGSVNAVRVLRQRQPVRTTLRGGACLIRKAFHRCQCK